MPKRVNENRKSQIFANVSEKDNEFRPLSTLNQHKKTGIIKQDEETLSDKIWTETPLLIVEKILYHLYVIRLEEMSLAESKMSELDLYEGTKFAVPFESSSKNSNCFKDFKVRSYMRIYIKRSNYAFADASM